MKTGNPLVRNAHYLCKVPTNNWLRRLIWWAFRKYLLNEDYWVVDQKFSGPRTGVGASYCLKENAVARRIYIDVRHRPQATRLFSVPIDSRKRA